MKTYFRRIGNNKSASSAKTRNVTIPYKDIKFEVNMNKVNLYISYLTM
jgi:hypothetical protein